MEPLGFLESLITLSCLLNLTLASNFPAIFNFGDSNSDTGGFAACAFEVPVVPNGETFFRMPAGRYCDGRLIIDFIAEELGLPHLNAYLDSLGSNFSNGASFSTAASTIIPQTSVFPLGGYSPFSLDVQFKQFLEFKSRSKILKKKGGVFSYLLPDEDQFSRALYTFDIGQNDIGAGFLGNVSVEEVHASIPDMIHNFSAIVTNIYKQGGRSFWIHNTGPLGCLPYIFVNLASPKDRNGCATLYNELARHFNRKLKESVVRLRNELPLAAITHVDVYSVKYTLISQAETYGFERPLVACCGHGGEYNYDRAVHCGGTININGTLVFAGSCERPSVRVNWDGTHYTEAANKWIFDQISTGAYSDPPLPLRLLCSITRLSIKNAGREKSM